MLVSEQTSKLVSRQAGKQQAGETSQPVRPVGCIKDSFSCQHDIKPHDPYHGLSLQALAACKDENIRKMINHNHGTKGLISKVKKKVLT